MTHSDSPALLDGLKLINWCSILPETRCDPPKFPRLAEMDGSYELWIFRPMYPMFGVLHFHEKSWILNGFFLSNSSDLEWMNDWMDHLHSGKIIISNLPPEVGPLKKTSPWIHPHHQTLSNYHPRRRQQRRWLTIVVCEAQKAVTFFLWEKICQERTVQMISANIQMVFFGVYPMDPNTSSDSTPTIISHHAPNTS